MENQDDKTYQKKLTSLVFKYFVSHSNPYQKCLVILGVYVEKQILADISLSDSLPPPSNINIDLTNLVSVEL